MVEKFRTYNKLNENISELEKYAEFQVGSMFLLDKFFNDIVDFDIVLRVGDNELDIPLGPESYEAMELFVQTLVESEDDYDKEKYKKIVDKIKKIRDFNL